MKHIALASAAVLVLLAASCTQNDGGIFAGIESEQKVVSLGGLNKYASVFSMAEDTSATPKVYYAAGGKALFSRDADATTWNAGTVGGSSEVNAVGEAGTTVWAVAGGKLYQRSAGSWTVQPVSGGETVTNLVPVIDADGITVVGQYVVTKSTAGSYSKIYRISSTGTLNTNAAQLVTGATLPVGSATVDIPAPGITSAVATDGSHDVVLSRSFLWDIATPDASPAVDGFRPAGSVPNSEYAGLLYLGSATKLFVSVSSNSTTGGGIYYATLAAGSAAAAATFSSAVDGTDLTYSSKAVSPAQMRYLSGTTSLWVGTVSGNATYEGNGVLEVKGTTGSPTVSVTPSTSLVTSSNYSSTGLSVVSTPVIYRTSDGTVFLGTAAHGLWKWNASDKIFEQQ